MRDTLRDAKGGGRVLRGSVSGAGAITAGTGFTVLRTAAGRYTITPLVPFATPPEVNATTSDAQNCVASMGGDWTVFGGQIRTTVGNTAVEADHPFDFVATEQER